MDLFVLLLTDGLSRCWSEERDMLQLLTMTSGRRAQSMSATLQVFLSCLYLFTACMSPNSFISGGPRVRVWSTAECQKMICRLS